MTHELKTWPVFFQPISEGVKMFELRRDDREFLVGDMLNLCEFNPGVGLTGRNCYRIVTYILRDCIAFGLMDGFCILGLRVPDA